MATKSNGNKSNKKVFDVAKPGKTTANASSKPVIVGHKPMMKDPMVKDEEVSERAEDAKTAPVLSDDSDDKVSGAPAKQNETSDAKLQAPSATKITIKPPSEEEIAENTDKTDKTEPTDKEPEEPIEPPKEEEKSKPESTEEETTKPAESEETSEEAEASDESDKTEDSDSEKEVDSAADEESEDKNDSATGALGAVAAQAGQKKSKKEEEAEKEKHAHLEKLVQDKKYFAPIGVKTRRRSIRNLFIVTILMLLVVVVVLYLLIDANIIDLGVKLPYNLVSP